VLETSWLYLNSHYDNFCSSRSFSITLLSAFWSEARNSVIVLCSRGIYLSTVTTLSCAKRVSFLYFSISILWVDCSYISFASNSAIRLPWLGSATGPVGRASSNYWRRRISAYNRCRSPSSIPELPALLNTIISCINSCMRQNLILLRMFMISHSWIETRSRSSITFFLSLNKI
jgi:hypothetical protein